MFPLAFVVLVVSHYLQNEDLLGRVSNATDQPVFVAADVEHNAVAENTRTGERGLHVSPS